MAKIEWGHTIPPGWEVVQVYQSGSGRASISMERSMSSKKGRYEIFKADDDKWYFNRIAGNNEVEHPSQGYSTRGNAIAAIGRCMEDTSHYEITSREEMTFAASGQAQGTIKPNNQQWDGEKA